MVGNNLGTGVESQSHFTSNMRLGLTNMLRSEEKLPVQVRYVNRVQIDNLQRQMVERWVAVEHNNLENVPCAAKLSKQMKTYLNVLKTAKHQVLHQLAADSTSADNKHPRAPNLSQCIGSLQ